MIFQEIIARAEQLALNGTDGHLSPVVDSSMTAQVIYPHALKFVISQQSKKNVDEFTQTIAINFVNGVADVPSNVLTKWFDTMTIMPDLPFASFKPYTEFRLIVNTPDNYRDQIPYFSINGNKMYFQNGTGRANGNFNFSLPVVPATPTSATQDVALSNDLINDVIVKIASVLKGEVKLETLLAE